MDADTWAGTEDWAAMLRGVPDVPGRRKLRLWCVAWARAILAEADDLARHPQTRGWFDPARVAGYAHKTDAIEEAADGRISRRQLHVAMTGPGGPFGLFNLAARATRPSLGRLCADLTAFARTFGLPTPRRLADLLRDVFGNPFRPVAFDPEWRTSAAVALARSMYDARDFAYLPVLADALEDAGCAVGAVLRHCRHPLRTHVRGCWVVDRVLGLG